MEDSLETKEFTIDAEAEDLIQIFEQWFKKECEPYHNEILRAQQKNFDYYIGNQTEKDQVPNYLSDTVENRIFEAVETMVPVVTANAHEFQVLPGSEDEKAVKRANSLRKVLSQKYEDLDMKEKLENATRHILLSRFAVLKYGWDYYNDDVMVEVKNPKLIYVPKMRVDPHRLPYVIEVDGYSRADIEEFFPDVDVDELSKEKFKDEFQADSEYEAYIVYEVWTDEMVAWFCSNKLLDKQPNPYFDFKGEKVKSYLKGDKRKRGKMAEKLKFYNHLDRPEKPYVFFATFNPGNYCLPPTSLVEIIIPIQDDINGRKRAIYNNLSQMGNGRVMADAEAITQEEAENITNEPGLVLRGKGLASEGRIKFEPGTPLPEAHFAALQQSEIVFDNVMGLHGATRGAAQAKTLGQDILSRQQDFSRIDLITRVLNRGVKRIANGLVQLMKMFYTEKHLVKTIGESGAVEFVSLNRDDIDDYIEIIVKSGVQLPMDEVSLRNEAVQLWQQGALDPVTLFERLKFPNPEKSAERLIAWKQGQLTMETQMKIAAGNAEAMNQMKLQSMQQQMGMSQPKPSGKPGAGENTQSGPNGSPRGSETQNNVMQRAGIESLSIGNSLAKVNKTV